MSRPLALVCLAAISVWLTSCAVTRGTQGPVLINVTNSFTSIQAGAAAVTLTAAVQNGQSGVSWSLTYANQSCAPDCGTLVTTGGSSATYTPPATAPTYGQATITVVSNADSKINYVLEFQIIPAISVSIANKFSTQTAGGSSVTVRATVSYDSANAGVTWTLTANGTSCSPACGTLTPGAGSPILTASYQPPPTVPLGTNVSPTITATSVTSTSKFDSLSFSIVSASIRLQGSYALLLRGYDLSGVPMAVAGGVTADGMGNITAGEFDFDNGGGITPVPAPVVGNYSIDPSFNNVSRGRIAITSFTFPGSNISIAFDFVLSADGKHGRVVESDGSGFINAGTILQQDTSAFAAANPSGPYAFGLDSDAPVGGRVVEAGQFVLAAGVVTSGVVDQSKAGNLTPIYSSAKIMQGSATSPDALGRGTLTLTVEGNANVKENSTLYAYYIVNSGQLNMVQIDQGLAFGTVQAGVAYAQKLPFTATSVNTTSVLQMTGMDAIPGTVSGIGPDAIIGVLKISGGSQFTLTFDENDIGTVITGQKANGSVSGINGEFDPATGRGTLNDPGGFANAFMDNSVFYLYDAGKGFIIDADISTCAPPPPAVPPGCVVAQTPAAAITNNAFSGTFTPQSGGPFSSSSINGNLIGGFGSTAIPDIPDMEAGFVADTANGTLTAVGDLDSLATQSGNLRNISFSGTYLMKDTTQGYGSATLPAFVFGNFVPNALSPEPASFYVIGPNQFVLIGTQKGLFSGISFLDSQ